jgi:hypothetical protein
MDGSGERDDERCLFREEGNVLSDWALSVRSSCLGYRLKGDVAMSGKGKGDE